MTIFGIDVSRYQAGIDMAQVRAEGMDFVIAKVTEGATYRSPAWPAQRDDARTAGLLLAAYHYVRTDDPALQAANCRSALGDTTIPIMLDWEENSGDWGNFAAVADAFRAAGLRVVLGYLPRWYWAQQGSPPLAGFALVSSRYPSSATGSPAEVYRSVTATTWSGYGGLTPTILQFTDRATVAGQQVDANAFPGTRVQLSALLGLSPPAPAPAPPVPQTIVPEDPVIAFSWPAGVGSHKLICPVGKASGVTAAAWLSLACDGVISHYDVWFQSDTAGISEQHGSVAKDCRVWWPVPDGTTQMTVHYVSTGPVGAAIEVKAK